MFYVMNHPKPEQWVPYLYGGLKPDERRQLKSHLQDCATCRAELERWQRSSRRLDAWKLPRCKTPLELFAPAFKWAVAAMVVLGVGFAFGRFAGDAAVADRVRAQIEPQLRQEMAEVVRKEVGRNSAAILQASVNKTKDLLADYSTVSESRRTEDLQWLYLALKRQLDTVALNTANEFVQLASYHPPGSTSTPH